MQIRTLYVRNSTILYKYDIRKLRIRLANDQIRPKNRDSPLDRETEFPMCRGRHRCQGSFIDPDYFDLSSLF